MNENLDLDGKLETERAICQQRYKDHPPVGENQWCDAAALAIAAIGVRRAVRLGDPRIWRHAVAELDAGIPLLNLPLLLWDAYQSHPFDGFTVHKKDGEKVVVPDWSHFFYAWHARRCAVRQKERVYFFDADEIVAVECMGPPSPQIAILERIRWLHAANPFAAFAVHTRQGQAVLVEKQNQLQLDPSASFLVLALGEEGPPLIIRVADIVSVRLASHSAATLKQEMTVRLHASPFVPFHLHLLNGGRYTILQPNDVLVTRDNMYVGVGKSEEQFSDSAVKVPWSWLDRIELVPPNPNA